MKLVVDSWAWVELLKASAAGKIARDRIDETSDAFTPSIVLAELSRKYLREGEKPASIRRWLEGITEATQIIDIDIHLAEESAKAWLYLLKRAKEFGLNSPGLGDAIILATARLWQARVLTGDPHFEGLPETSWIGD